MGEGSGSCVPGGRWPVLPGRSGRPGVAPSRPGMLAVMCEMVDGHRLVECPRPPFVAATSTVVRATTTATTFATTAAAGRTQSGVTQGAGGLPSRPGAFVPPPPSASCGKGRRARWSLTGGAQSACVPAVLAPRTTDDDARRGAAPVRHHPPRLDCVRGRRRPHGGRALRRVLSH